MIGSPKNKEEQAFYSSVHQWLAKTYGKANKCENRKCNGKSIYFNWSKKRGLKYDYKRDSFIQLCRSCHSKMDCTVKTRKLMSEANPRTHLKFCKRGHRFTKKNIYIHPKRKRHRICLTCKKETAKVWNQQNVISCRKYRKKWKDKMRSRKFGLDITN